MGKSVCGWLLYDDCRIVLEAGSGPAATTVGVSACDALGWAKPDLATTRKTITVCGGEVSQTRILVG